jgi:long-chain fatty acid transport protein
MKLSQVFVGLALAGLAGGAFATNGYFSHGYGMKAKGMAGASTASTDDAFGGANNPASMAFAGNRMDLGADLFSPIREASNTNFGGGGPVRSESDSNYFLIPEFGYNRMMNDNLSLGVTVYGNGGMNTDYPSIPNFGGANILGGSGSLGVDLMQLIVAPTVAYKVAPAHSLGISPLLGYQRFRAEGLNGFGLNNQGYDDAFGYGVRLGYLGKITPTVTIGAAYASKMRFEEFSKYSGLFAEQGDFDIAENWNLGASWQTTPSIKLALDFQRINYSKIAAVGNQVLPNFGNGLGASNGPGFGWDDIDVWKFGAEYKYSTNLTLRAGYSHTDSPIKGDMTCATFTNCAEAAFNILAPAVIENHVTLGFTYTLASGDEVTMAYMHGFENDVRGARPANFNNAVAGSVDTIKMYQNSLGIQYSWKM